MTNFLKIKAENDRWFKEHNLPQMTSEYISDFTPVHLERGRSEFYSVKDNIRSISTVDCILENAGKRIIALNFANALFPGGAYVMGGSAQEESLCRASMLYYAIRSANEFYSANRRHITPDYTDGLIYSKNVPVIRSNNGEFLASPVLCDFITCPAVNRYEAALCFMPVKKTNEIMKRRIGRIVSFAMSQKPEVIILGAFGCGAFGNRREDIFPMFEEAVNEFTDDSAEVVFAVIG